MKRNKADKKKTIKKLYQTKYNSNNGVWRGQIYTPMTFSSQGSHLIATMFGLPNKIIDFIERDGKSPNDINSLS